MNAIKRTGIIGCLAAGMLTASAAWSETEIQEQAPPKGRGMREAKGERAQERQRGENAEKPDGNQGERRQGRQKRGPSREHRQARQEQRQKMMKAMRDEADPQAALAILRAHMESNHAARVAFQEQQWEKMLSMLDSLNANQDLTKEDIREAMKGMRHSQPPGASREKHQSPRQ